MTLKTFIELAGWSGAALILAAYALLSFGKIQPRSRVYQAMNIAGAIGFIVNCGWSRDWPPLALNVVWLVIGIYALRRNHRAAR